MRPSTVLRRKGVFPDALRGVPIRRYPVVDPSPLYYNKTLNLKDQRIRDQDTAVPNISQGDTSPNLAEVEKPEDIKPGHLSATPYILTLATTTELHKTLTLLRKKHYVETQNRRAAHITLFRGLPKNLYTVVEDIRKLVAGTQAFAIRTAAEATPIPSGVILEISLNSERISAIHDALYSKWRADGILSPTDLRIGLSTRGVTHGSPSTTIKGRWTPSVVLQHNVQDPETVRQTVAKVNAELKRLEDETTLPKHDKRSVHGLATGLALFRRHKGKWQFLRRFNFRDVPSRGWQRPETVTIPTLEGVNSKGGLF